jgi:hypothetical protein
VNKFTWITLLFVVLLTLLLVINVLAMSSNRYAMDWYVPVTGGGGGEVSSANYTANYTVGQAVIGPSSSTSFSSSLGYWYGLLLERVTTLPIVFQK